MGEDRKPCLAACEDQVNAVSVTSSSFPNRETFMEREEFCILVEKLIREVMQKSSYRITNAFHRTCKSSGKYYVLSKFYPNLCHLLWEIRNVTATTVGASTVCHNMKWSPQDMGFTGADPRESLATIQYIN